MAAVEKASGITAFGPPPASSYRFAISSNHDKMRLWHEDVKTKRQWCTGFLDDEDFVSAMDRLPRASIDDYISLFADTMRFCMSQTQDGNLEDIDLDKLTADKIRRRLTELEDDTLELELMVEVRALSSAWFTKYVLQLKPISLERVDVVEAKLRDVEEKLVRTEKLLADLIGKQVVHLSAVSSNVDKLNEDGDIMWNEQKCDHFEQNSERNGIICLVEGWYTLNLTVFLIQQKCNGGVTLRKNNIRLLESQVPKIVGENTSTSLGWCGLLKKNDELSVIATENPLQVGAELMMMRLSEAA